MARRLSVGKGIMRKKWAVTGPMPPVGDAGTCRKVFHGNSFLPFGGSEPETYLID